MKEGQNWLQTSVELPLVLTKTGRRMTGVVGFLAAMAAIGAPAEVFAKEKGKEISVLADNPCTPLPDGIVLSGVLNTKTETKKVKGQVVTVDTLTQNTEGEDLNGIKYRQDRTSVTTLDSNKNGTIEIEEDLVAIGKGSRGIADFHSRITAIVAGGYTINIIANDPCGKR